MTKQAVNAILFIPLVSLISGIIFCLHAPISISVVACMFLIILYMTYHANTFSNNPTIGMLIIFFLAGILLLGIQKQKHAILEKHILQKSFDFIASVSVKTCSPQSRIKETLCLSIQQSKHSTEKNFHNYNYNIMCYIETPTMLEVDDVIELTNIHIRHPKNTPTASGNPTFDAYLYKENIAATLFVKKLSFKLIHKPRFSLKRYCMNVCQGLATSLKRKMSWTTFKLVSCIFFGDKRMLKNSPLKDSFNFWGISHYLARSGLHVMILLFVLTLSLRPIPIPHYAKRILIILFCLIYCLLSWSSISFFRALAVFLLCEAGLFVTKKPHPLYLLGIVCFLILAFNPFQLFFLDFQLSFLLTAALSWFARNIN